MENEERKALKAKVKKEKIQKIKEKYNNIGMDDKTASRIATVEVVNNVLKAATTIVGIVAAVDIAIPDPVFGIDEAILTGVTALLKLSTSIIDKQLEKYSKGDKSIDQEDVTNLASSIRNVVDTINNSKTQKVR